MSDDNVISFSAPKDELIGDAVNLEPNQVLECAKDDFLSVVICGWTKEGEIEVRASGGSREALWWLTRAIHMITENGQ